MTGIASASEKHFGSAALWLAMCVAAGWILGGSIGMPWVGAIAGAAAGVLTGWMSLYEPLAGATLIWGVLAAVAMFLEPDWRSAAAFSIAGWSALLSCLLLWDVASTWIENRPIRRALAARDHRTLIEHYPWPDGYEARALEILRADPSVVGLAVARRESLPKGERWRMSRLLGELGFAEARPVLRRALEGREDDSYAALHALIRLGDAEDAPLIFAHLRRDDDATIRIAIDLALRHRRRDLIEGLAVGKSLGEYREQALSKLA